MKTKMDSNLNKLEKLNHLTGKSFFGLLACLFLVLVFNYFQFQFLFFLLTDNPMLTLIGLIWFVIFFMIQAGIIKVIYRKLSSGDFVIYSPTNGKKEFVRFILFIIFAVLFFAFNFGYYPLKTFSFSIVYEVIFFIISFAISTAYWKYVEAYRNDSVYVPKFSKYNSWNLVTICVVLVMFGGVAVILPYSPFGVIGFGAWFLMLSRFLIGE